jgi:SAM-dependent methyltransferase
VLDIGCGSGHSLKWYGDNGVSELLDLDISTNQIENAKKFFNQNGFAPKLFIYRGLPKEYFDVVYSIYAIGWTVDLQTTFNNIASYLKKDEVFIFSWDYPIMRCIEVQNDKFVFEGYYHNEDSFSYMQRGNPVTIKNRKLSTYINALAKAGLMVEQFVEETDSKTLMEPTEISSGYYSSYKARKFLSRRKFYEWINLHIFKLKNTCCFA